MPDNEDYIKANWAKLSPNFRNAHNRLRQLQGKATIPPPKIDLYVAPRGPESKPYDFNDKEFVAAGKQFLGATMIMGPRGRNGQPNEGFEVRPASPR